MISIILYRGGMCGDLIGSILDPNIHKKVSVNVDTDNKLFLPDIKKSRTKLKKFWKYNDSTKLSYCNKFIKFNNNIVLLSHDTDFSYNYFFKESFQIVCNNEKLLKLFSSRFYVLHKLEVINQVSNYIKSDENFVSSYYNDILNWQNYYKFENIFDISNIYDKNFYKDLCKTFSNINIDRAKQLHYNWLINEEKNIDLYNKYL